jgi:hypothetical protein
VRRATGRRTRFGRRRLAVCMTATPTRQMLCVQRIVAAGIRTRIRQSTIVVHTRQTLFGQLF